MTEAEIQESQFSRGKFWISSGWIALALIYSLVTAFSYNGLYRFLAEAQFAWIDRYFPLVTMFAIALVLSLPLLLILWFRKLRRKEEEDQSAQATQKAETLWQRGVVFSWLAGICAVALVVQLLSLISLPSASGEVSDYTASDVANAHERDIDIDGPARLTEGTIRTDIVSYLEDGLFLGILECKFAPVQVATMPETAPITLFLEIKSDGSSGAPFEVISEGVLQRKAIPSEIHSLYREEGLNVSPEAFVLYEDRSSMSIRPILFGVVALILMLSFALIANSATRSRKELISRS